MAEGRQPRRPRPEEYAPVYEKYIDLVPGSDILGVLADQRGAVRELLGNLTAEEPGYRYAERKWSVREVVGHLSDNERVFAYRALRLARGDTRPLEGFDHDAWVSRGGFDGREMEELVDELITVRDATISLLKSLGETDLRRTGTANGAVLSPLAAMFICAGHLEHHLRILRERYLDAPRTG